MQDCTHLSRFALVSRFFPDRYAKKYTGYCIIACVPMWRRVQDSNPRGHHCPNGFQDRPVMTASVTLRVC